MLVKDFNKELINKHIKLITMSLKDFQAKLKEIAGVKEPTIKIEDDTTVTYTKKCNITGKDYVVNITAIQHAKLLERVFHIQTVLPNLSAEQREFLISGTTPDEWNDMFKEPED